MLALVAGSPAAGALRGFDWPIQSLGNRGVDVTTIQRLLVHRGVSAAYNGVFTTGTRDAVRTFQSRRGLPITGVVDAATWTALVPTVRPGGSGVAVRSLQHQLNAKVGAGLEVSGVYDAATIAAVRAFERHVGITIDDNADPRTWRYLVAHFDQPSFSRSGLCDYSVGNGPANWGRAATIAQVEAAGAAIAAAGYGRVPVGDISFEHGGDIPEHATHEIGLDVDLRPMRDNRDQCTWGTNWRLTSYNRTATRELIRAIRAAAPGHVELIYFNDPVLVEEGLTTSYAGHDDHLHVRYCETGHPFAAYRC